MAEKNIGIIFDGTTCFEEALAIVVRNVKDWEIKQRLIRPQLLVKTMSGEKIAREIVRTVSAEHGVAGNHLLASMRDRVAANGVAMHTIKILFPNILDIGCYLHTLDHIGDRFKVHSIVD